jgi:hypothetical protein
VAMRRREKGRRTTARRGVDWRTQIAEMKEVREAHQEEGEGKARTERGRRWGEEMSSS